MVTPGMGFPAESQARESPAPWPEFWRPSFSLAERTRDA